MDKNIGIDITSYLLGKKAGGGGGETSEYNVKVDASTPISNKNYMYYYITKIDDSFTTSRTSLNSFFYDLISLENIPLFDTSNVTDMTSMCYNCAKLKDLPAFNTSSVTSLQNFVTGCTSLTNESLNNVLKMCANSSLRFSNQKTLQKVGLTQEQATICQSLSNYQEFLDAGWTTGY